MPIPKHRMIQARAPYTVYRALNKARYDYLNPRETTVNHVVMNILYAWFKENRDRLFHKTQPKEKTKNEKK